MSQSQKMRRALDRYVIPGLTEKGFEGKYPHFRRVFDDRLELLTFQPCKWGNGFSVGVSAVFMPHSGRNSNFVSGDFKSIEDATVYDTFVRYSLKGIFDGCFYYTDVYRQKIRGCVFYNAVSEDGAKNYVPAKGEVRVQTADGEIYEKVCTEVMRQMERAYLWLDAFSRNKRLRMKFL